MIKENCDKDFYRLLNKCDDYNVDLITENSTYYYLAQTNEANERGKISVGKFTEARKCYDLFSLAHEFGHNKSKQIGNWKKNNYIGSLKLRVKDLLSLSLRDRCNILLEEVRAWYYGFFLLKENKIKISLTDYLKCATKCLSGYLKSFMQTNDMYRIYKKNRKAWVEALLKTNFSSWDHVAIINYSDDGKSETLGMINISNLKEYLMNNNYSTEFSTRILERALVYEVGMTLFLINCEKEKWSFGWDVRGLRRKNYEIN